MRYVVVHTNVTSPTAGAPSNGAIVKCIRVSFCKANVSGGLINTELPQCSLLERSWTHIPGKCKHAFISLIELTYRSS